MATFVNGVGNSSVRTDFYPHEIDQCRLVLEEKWSNRVMMSGHTKPGSDSRMTCVLDRVLPYTPD